FPRRNSARYDPSWPVMPLIRAFFTRPLLSVALEVAELCLDYTALSTDCPVLVFSQPIDARPPQAVVHSFTSNVPTFYDPLRRSAIPISEGSRRCRCWRQRLLGGL